MKITGIMRYNRKNNRYGMLVNDLWEIEGFHCGDTLEVWDREKEKWITTRVEMHYQSSAFHFPKERNDGWYLVDTPYNGTDLEGLKIRANFWDDEEEDINELI